MPRIIMEAICDDRPYFRHAFFGASKSNSDNTLLEAFPLLGKTAKGEYLGACDYKVSVESRNKSYWLVDGIYPKYPCSVYFILNPCKKYESYFAGRQEEQRKNVRRGFEILQSKFHILVVYPVDSRRKKI